MQTLNYTVCWSNKQFLWTGVEILSHLTPKPAADGVSCRFWWRAEHQFSFVSEHLSLCRTSLRNYDGCWGHVKWQTMMIFKGSAAGCVVSVQMSELTADCTTLFTAQSFLQGLPVTDDDTLRLFPKWDKRWKSVSEIFMAVSFSTFWAVILKRNGCAFQSKLWRRLHSCLSDTNILFFFQPFSLF